MIRAPLWTRLGNRRYELVVPPRGYVVPAGAQPAAFAKALAERGLDPTKVKVLGTGEVTAESALKSMGDASLGIITACCGAPFFLWLLSRYRREVGYL